jgi:hypothetical protein
VLARLVTVVAAPVLSVSAPPALLTGPTVAAPPAVRLSTPVPLLTPPVDIAPAAVTASAARAVGQIPKRQRPAKAEGHRAATR